MSLLCYSNRVFFCAYKCCCFLDLWHYPKVTQFFLVYHCWKKQKKKQKSQQLKALTSFISMKEVNERSLDFEILGLNYLVLICIYMSNNLAVQRSKYYGVFAFLKFYGEINVTCYWVSTLSVCLCEAHEYNRNLMLKLVKHLEKHMESSFEEF